MIQTHPTEGLPQRVDQPFLNRQVHTFPEAAILTFRSLADIPEDANAGAFETKSGLEIKIALGNYRMFFTPGTEDYFHRQSRSTRAQIAESDAKDESNREEATKKLDEFVQAKLKLNQTDAEPVLPKPTSVAA